MNVRARAYTDQMEPNTLATEPHCLHGFDDERTGEWEPGGGEHDLRGEWEFGAGGAGGERDYNGGARDERAEIDEREREREREMPIIDAGWTQPTTIEIGASAEQRAVHHLEHGGYRIVERNFKTKLGELDIVARDRDGVLCFIEVRSRTNHDFGNAAESVNQLKRGKVTRMAQIYLTQRRPRFDEARFDVVALTGDRIDLIRDAWRLGDRT